MNLVVFFKGLFSKFGQLIAFNVAVLETLSIAVFAFSKIYADHPFLSLASICFVFYFCSVSANRNIIKVSHLLDPGVKPGSVLEFDYKKSLHVFNFGLAVFTVLISILTKHFALLVLFNGVGVYRNVLISFSLILYGIYTFLNNLADLQRVTDDFFPDDQKKSGPFLYSMKYLSSVIKPGLSTDPKFAWDALLLYAFLIYCSLMTSHYKAAGVQFSLLTLSKHYGGIYSFLSKYSSVVYFPIISIGIMNTKKCFSNLRGLCGRINNMTLVDLAKFTGMSLAAYISAISSKSLALAVDDGLSFVNPHVFLWSDKVANYVRQGGENMCHSDQKQIGVPHANS